MMILSSLVEWDFRFLGETLMYEKYFCSFGNVKKLNRKNLHFWTHEIKGREDQVLRDFPRLAVLK